MRRVLTIVLRAVLAGGVLFVAWLFAVWPPPVWYRSHWPAETAFMRMRRLQGSEIKAYKPVPIEAMTPTLAAAAVAGEDNNFWTHGGIDFQAIRVAMGYRHEDFGWFAGGDWSELSRAVGKAWSRREDVRGGSTITQQLAKNLYLSPTRNPLRKVKEAVTTYRLEAALGKVRIMELYLNVAEFGDGIWGVEAASETYYGVSAKRLTRGQAAALAGSLPFPLRSNPGKRPGRMRWRQALILRRLRGERIAIPHDTAPSDAKLDSLLDSLRAPVETLPPAPDSSP